MNWTGEEYTAYLQKAGKPTAKPKRHKYNAKANKGSAAQ